MKHRTLQILFAYWNGLRAGRIAPMAKTMLVPEAWSKLATKMPQAWLDMYAYSNAVMEPWDGPAALAMTDGRWVCAGLDRNGLPLGLQVIGRAWDEATVFRVGKALEAAAGFEALPYGLEEAA